MTRMILICAALSAAASLAVAGGELSAERGRQLFGNKELGTSGKSCASCHPGGKGLEKAAVLPEGELAQIINECITKPLKGTTLEPASAEMKSLVAYIRSLSPAKGN